MKFWFDTEFIEDGKTIDLMSIGIVSEDGRTYYAECAECDLSRANPWVRENVIPHLNGRTKPRAIIAAEICAFVGDKPCFWGYYADYDWVALCQLYGTMIQIPKDWPMLAYDFRQWLDMNHLQHVKQPDGPFCHNALEDARWLASAFMEHVAR